MKRLNCFRLFLAYFFIYPVVLLADEVTIGIYNETNISSMVFSPVKSSYIMVTGASENLIVKEGDIIYINFVGDSFRVMGLNTVYGYFSEVDFLPSDDSSIFSVKAITPASQRRQYDDKLKIRIRFNRMQLLNTVNMEKYIAGVVQSEGGVRATMEYYKTQAVLCRTYMIAHFHRHAEEGFHLCDNVHCQAYYSRCDRNPMIAEAAFETVGQVVVDVNDELILSAFHSNCGGETENSERVWSQKRSYLRSVPDPYCQNTRNSSWEKSIPMDQWRDYLAKNGIKGAKDYDYSFFNLVQYARKTHYRVKSDSIELKKIRSDFALKSTFFSIQASENNIVIRGKGYGHGVGLCQEGAMQMSKLGYNYIEIINFYYKDTRTVDYHEIGKDVNAKRDSVLLK